MRGKISESYEVQTCGCLVRLIAIFSQISTSGRASLQECTVRTKFRCSSGHNTSNAAVAASHLDYFSGVQQR